ncbi:MAG: PP2C family protein-serine/threonine phosphatase [Armatimonadota bacterium]
MARQVNSLTGRMRLAYQNVPQESELVVAILRTVLIFLAALAAALGTAGTIRPEMKLSILAAIVYNAALFILALLRIRIHGQRQAMLVLDILLVTAWVYFTWGTGLDAGPSPLVPFYYLVIVVGALWFGITGTLATAAGISALYLLLIFHFSGGDALAMVEAIYRQVIYLFLVGLAAGYVVDTHKREREQWARSQVLLAQYQERFRAAQEMYETLIPVQMPTVAGLELAARWRPALREGGGDFYDVVPLSDGRVMLIVADVAGKATHGVTKLPLFKAAFLAASQVWDDPGEILSRVNQIVYPQLQPDMFITACVLIIDQKRHTFLYANAGQDAPIFVRNRTRETVLLETGGLVLGIDRKATYPTEEQELEPGDTLCLYTDGITEARDAAGEEFGYQNLEARVLAGVAIGLSLESIVENIFEAVQQHAYRESRHDDTTLMMVRYRPEELETMAEGEAAAVKNG